MRTQIRLWVINCSECPHDCHITQATLWSKCIQVPEYSQKDFPVLAHHFHPANSLNMVHETRQQFLLPPPTLYSSCLWQAGYQGWVFFLASAGGGWHYLRAGKGWHPVDWNAVDHVQTLWPYLSTSHLALDEAIKTNIFDTLLTLRLKCSGTIFLAQCITLGDDQTLLWLQFGSNAKWIAAEVVLLKERLCHKENCNMDHEKRLGNAI